MRLEELRRQHPSLCYQSFASRLQGDTLQLNFIFELSPGIIFRPKAFIYHIDVRRFHTLDPALLQNFVFHLGILELLSYWKLTCSPVIRIAAGIVNDTQMMWWKDLFLQGLGEFFYKHEIDYTVPDFFRFEFSDQRKIPPDDSQLIPKSFSCDLDERRVLVPLGGGRDSVVIIEFLNRSPFKLALCMLNPTKAQRDVARVSGIADPIVVERVLDPKLLELNAQDYLNGHVPISAYYAFYSCFAAVLFGQKFVAISQERSSNEATVDFHGKRVNHQYSKSFEFEEKFRAYLKNFLVSDIEYFSFLRPLYSLQISKIFSGMPEYFSVFRSCNRGQKTNSWCGSCAKCLFTYASLYPFVSESDLQSIFVTSIFTKTELIDIALELIGERSAKPFECVGTREENKVTFFLCIQKYRKLHADGAVPPVLSAVDRVLASEKGMERRAQDLLTSWNSSHHLPRQFETLLHS